MCKSLSRIAVDSHRFYCLTTDFVPDRWHWFFVSSRFASVWNIFQDRRYEKRKIASLEDRKHTCAWINYKNIFGCSAKNEVEVFAQGHFHVCLLDEQSACEENYITCRNILFIVEQFVTNQESVWSEVNFKSGRRRGKGILNLDGLMIFNS